MSTRDVKLVTMIPRALPADVAVEVGYISQ